MGLPRETHAIDRPINQWKMQPTTILKRLNPVQKPFVWIGSVAAIILFISILFTAGSTQGVLYLIGIALGVTLLHARFGFNSAFRRLVSVGNVQGIQAHMVMLVVATTLFAIILSSGFSFTGVMPSGYVSPVGISIIVGSFIFGIGMQMGNGCASGTLYNLGGGKSSMVLTLLSFIVGSVVGAYQLGFWLDLPSLPPISLAESTGLGYLGGWVIQILLFFGIYGLTLIIAKRKNPPQMKPLATTKGFKKIWRGAWPLITAGVVLAVLNAFTLSVRGQPWGVTSAFVLWGSKFLQFFGIDVASWSYWQGDAQALQQTVLADSTSVLNFGIILGAFIDRKSV